jgi:pyrroline-5-carboxylate reductase
MTSLPALLLVGGGRMGGAMLAGWRELGLSLRNGGGSISGGG